jgi:putative tricarboxylic transport membrane protein
VRAPVRGRAFERIVLGGLFVLGALFFAGTFAIERGFGGGKADLGSRFAPQLFAGALMVFSALGMIARKGDEEHRLGVDAVVAFIVVVVIAYAAALPVLGYAISTFAALVLVLAAVRADAWWRILLFAAGMTGGLYFVFERIMLVGLPVGPLGF